VSFDDRSFSVFGSKAGLTHAKVSACLKPFWQSWLQQLAPFKFAEMVLISLLALSVSQYCSLCWRSIRLAREAESQRCHAIFQRLYFEWHKKYMYEQIFHVRGRVGAQLSQLTEVTE
jgi:hypothetical protein